MKLNIKTILVPVDFSETSLNALDHAIGLARVYNAAITLLNVIEVGYADTNPFHLESNTIIDDVLANNKIAEIAQDKLVELAEAIAQKEQLTVSVKVELGASNSKIVELAKELKADIIVMGTHGASGFKELVMGSNANKVVNDAQCPVLTIRASAKPRGYKNIVVPFRDKLHSRENIYPSIKIAEAFNATIHLIGIDTEKSASHLDLIEYEVMQSAKIIKKHHVQTIENVLSDSFDATTIIKIAQEKNADMIVLVADTDENDFKDFFVGSLVDQIVNRSVIPVLSIRPDINEASIEEEPLGFDWQ